MWLAPSGAPLIARVTFAREIISTVMFTCALAMIEGGVIAVFARHTFDDSVPEGRLNFFVAILGSMNELANILSFVWSGLVAGRRIVPFINSLQVATIVLIGIIALLPQAASGLYGLVALVLLARLCWSGMITMRTGVWRANYPPSMRARIVGRISSAQMLVVAASGSGLGWVLDHNQDAYRLLLPAACAVALTAVWAYRGIRVRHEQRIIDKHADVMKPWHGPLVVARVLRSDKRYAQFMLCMFVLGFGNLMINPILVITLAEEFGFTYFKGILITSSIQSVTQVLLIPVWARLLDRSHVVRFRSLHSWVFVAGSLIFTIATISHRVELMFLGAVVQGAAYAGGALAWNLGHVDFSPPSQTSNYMATHVTLNGVRGLLAPMVSVTLYESIKGLGAEASAWMMAIALAVNAAGAAGFVALRISMGQATKFAKRE